MPSVRNDTATGPGQGTAVTAVAAIGTVKTGAAGNAAPKQHDAHVEQVCA